MTKYPRAAGAALYTHKAFRAPFLTFFVAFAVMSSGIASASTLARAFAGDYLSEFVDLPLVLAALIFIVVVAAINARGIAESVKLNVVLTSIEVTGLLIIVVVGVAALGEGSGDFSRNFEFKDGESVFGAIVAGTALAFYAMIGFEDSVNVAEEAKQPSRNYPRALFIGIAAAGTLYLLVTLTASLVVPTDQLSGSDAPLLEVVEVGPLGIPTKLFPRAARAPHAVRGDPLHDRDRRRADSDRRPGNAGGHDGSAAAVRLHHREHRGAGAAPRARRARALHRPLDLSGTRSARVSVADPPHRAR